MLPFRLQDFKLARDDDNPSHPPSTKPYKMRVSKFKLQTEMSWNHAEGAERVVQFFCVVHIQLAANPSKLRIGLATHHNRSDPRVKQRHRAHDTRLAAKHKRHAVRAQIGDVIAAGLSFLSRLDLTVGGGSDSVEHLVGLMVAN